MLIISIRSLILFWVSQSGIVWVGQQHEFLAKFFSEHKGMEDTPKAGSNKFPLVDIHNSRFEFEKNYEVTIFSSKMQWEHIQGLSLGRIKD